MVLKQIALPLIATIIVAWRLKFFLAGHTAGLAIRRAIKQSTSLIPSGIYKSLSLYRPRVYGHLNGYKVQFGVSITHSSDEKSMSAELFEKVKLKHPPQVSLTEKDLLPVSICGKNFSIEWGWLSRYHRIGSSEPSIEEPRTSLIIKQGQERQVQYTPSEIVSEANQMLKESTLNNITSLIEIARQIDSGSVDISTQISENTRTAHREFLIGVLVTIGVIICYWVVFQFFLR